MIQRPPMIWRDEVTWVLPGATLAQVRDLADDGLPAKVASGQLVARVDGENRLDARQYFPARTGQRRC